MIVKARYVLSSLLTLFYAFSFVNTLAANDIVVPKDSLSPRLAALVRELQAGHSEALARFWIEIRGKAPLIEPIAANNKQYAITFLWRGDEKTRHASVLGGFPGPNIAKPMTRLLETDVWYRTEIHPSEARFQYVLQINGPKELPMKWSALMEEMGKNPPTPDPLNPKAYLGWSYVELPDAPAQPWVAKGAAPEGSLKSVKLLSKILNAEYSLNIYTPAGYNESNQPCWLAVTFDGGFLEMNNTLDNLLAAGKIPPLIVVGVNHHNRNRELGCSDEFADFLAKELVPWVQKSYRVYKDPAHTIVGGTSLGGKMAAYCGLKYSAVFGKVLSQSGEFAGGTQEESPSYIWVQETPNKLVNEFLKRPRVPLEFYMEIGCYETYFNFSPLLETRRLRDVLKAKGYKVIYSEFIGGHNEICWRGSLANAIISLTAQ